MIMMEAKDCGSDKENAGLNHYAVPTVGRPAALAASTAPATPPPMLILPPVAGTAIIFLVFRSFRSNTWHSDVGVAEDALLHVLEVSNSSLDFMDNILQAFLLSRV